jgi:hypothetical protein
MNECGNMARRATCACIAIAFIALLIVFFRPQQRSIDQAAPPETWPRGVSAKVLNTRWDNDELEVEYQLTRIAEPTARPVRMWVELLYHFFDAAGQRVSEAQEVYCEASAAFIFDHAPQDIIYLKFPVPDGAASFQLQLGGPRMPVRTEVSPVPPRPK